MLVGEIGISRREYLYELRHVDILLIARGYFKRKHSDWEQARFIAYHVRYCMGAKKDEVVPTIERWYPFPWEKEKPHNLPTEAEKRELQEDMKKPFKW
jgi:hypothetical protein